MNRSKCQYFNWRMMTRSYQVTSVSFRVSHPLTGTVDVVSPVNDFQFSQSEMHQLAMNEVNYFFNYMVCRPHYYIVDFAT
jgi:hypothetical protein